MKTAAEDKRERLLEQTNEITTHCAELIEFIAEHLPRQTRARNQILGLLAQISDLCEQLKTASIQLPQEVRAPVLAYVVICSSLANALTKELETREATWTEKISEIINPLQGKKKKQPSVKPGVISAKAKALMQSLQPKFQAVFADMPEAAAPALRAHANKLVELCRKLEGTVGKENPDQADALIAFIALLYGVIAGMKRSLR